MSSTIMHKRALACGMNPGQRGQSHSARIRQGDVLADDEEDDLDERDEADMSVPRDVPDMDLTPRLVRRRQGELAGRR